MLLCLRACEYDRANKQDYCTISTRGMTRFRADDDTEFIELNEWQQELTSFQSLIKVSILAHRVSQGTGRAVCRMCCSCFAHFHEDVTLSARSAEDRVHSGSADVQSLQHLNQTPQPDFLFKFVWLNKVFG